MSSTGPETSLPTTGSETQARAINQRRVSIRQDDLNAMCDLLSEAWEVFACIEQATSHDEVIGLACQGMSNLRAWAPPQGKGKLGEY